LGSVSSLAVTKAREPVTLSVLIGRLHFPLAHTPAMVIITRRIGERLRLETPATVTVLAVVGQAVRLAVDAPGGVVLEPAPGADPKGEKYADDFPPDDR